MQEQSFQQYAIVQADTAKLLTDELNQKLKELRHKNPVVTFEGLIARISYTESTREAEDESDEYELKGVNLFCDDCPMFKPALKSDGTPDLRSRRGECPYAHYGITDKNSKACNKLFEMINTGEVTLCLKK